MKSLFEVGAVVVFTCATSYFAMSAPIRAQTSVQAPDRASSLIQGQVVPAEKATCLDKLHWCLRDIGGTSGGEETCWDLFDICMATQ